MTQRAASSAWRDLRQGLLAGDSGQIREGTRHLAGLGGGLTPADDDRILEYLADNRAFRP